jgi:hypothetical protein
MMLAPNVLPPDRQAHAAISFDGLKKQSATKSKGELLPGV